MNNMHRIPLSILQLYQEGLMPKKEEQCQAQAGGDDGITIYKLPPEEVEKLLKAQYGNKLEAVQANAPGKHSKKAGSNLYSWSRR